MSEPLGTRTGAWDVARWLRLARKECRETLRDRRTLLTLVLMPLLVYPLMSVAFRQFLLTAAKPRPSTINVALTDTQFWSELNRAIARGKRVLAQRAGSLDQPLANTEIAAFLSEYVDVDVQSGRVDVGIRRRSIHASSPDPAPGRTANPLYDLELLYVSSDPTSVHAVEILTKLLRAASDDLLEEILRERGLAVAVPLIRFERTSVADEGPRGISFAALVPLILILMTITGAVYPAIDLTAGERERGTMEMLIAAPVARLPLLLAKYVAVLIVATLTGTLNLVSLLLTTSATGLGHLVWGAQGIDPWSVVLLFALQMLFAAFFSAVLLTITSFARSFKEAQAYLIPIMMLSMSPGMVSLMPGVQLTGWLYVVPLLNVVLLSRDLLEHAAHWPSVLIVVTVTLAYAVAAIAVAARVFGADAAVHVAGGGGASRSEGNARAPRLAASLGSMWLCLAVMFPLLFLTNGLLSQWTSLVPFARFMVIAAAQVLIFLGCPLVAALRERVALGDAFGWRAPTMWGWAGALFLGLGCWPLALELGLLIRLLGIDELPVLDDAQVRGLLDRLGAVDLPTMLFSLALAPAVCEEFCFRGFVLSSVRARGSAGRAIVVSAVLFGLFHVVTSGGLTAQRLVTTTLLGFVLGSVALRTGSIFPGMLLHALHNSSLLLLSKWKETLPESSWLRTEVGSAAAHVPGTWLAAAVLCVTIGAAFIWRSRKC